MTKMDYLKLLVDEIHSTTVATIGSDGHPQTRIIDMMYYDEEGVYFLTAKGKAFYDQLMEQQYVAISATKDKIAVSLRGKIKNIGKKNLDIMFEKNPYMKKIYPGDTKDAIEVFRLYEAQGEYGKIQCQKACHPKTYDAKDLFRKMDKARRDCLIPSELVPKCPVCGGNMAMNLRCDNYFVEDEAWHEAADRYAGFQEQNKDKKVVLLELGVGFNTPIIIRFPFEKMVRENSSYSLIRLNMDEAVVPESFGERAIGIGGDMAKAITDIRGLVL